MKKHLLTFTLVTLSALTSFADPVDCYRLATQNLANGGGSLNNELAVQLCGDSQDTMPVDCYRRAKNNLANGGASLSNSELAVALCKKK